MVQWSFSSNAFRAHSLGDTLRVLSELGYTGVEILADVPHAYPPHLAPGDIDAIRRALADSGLQLANINAFMLHALKDTWHPSWIEPDPQWRARRVDYTLQCIDLAAKLGAKTISTEPGGPLEGMDRSRALEIFYDGLCTVAPRAKDAGVRVLIEPEPGLLIETSAQFLELMAALDPEVFGLNFDIGHFYCVGEDPAELVATLAPHTHHFHLEDIAASRDRWFSYYWWSDPEREPDFAGTVDIHRKPGYDPLELFLLPGTRRISQNTALIKGSHGTPPIAARDRVPLIASGAGLDALPWPEQPRVTDIPALITAAFTG